MKHKYITLFLIGLALTLSLQANAENFDDLDLPEENGRCNTCAISHYGTTPRNIVTSRTK